MMMQQTGNPKNIIISGASSGIGKALALEYADQGVFLGLIGRNEERLTKVKEACEAKGASVAIMACDVRDFETLKPWIDKLDTEYPIDLIISNAGISGGTGNTGDIEDMPSIREIYDVNVFAAIELGQSLYDQFRKRKSGQIAFTGSIAGLQGWAGAPAYTSSKAALHIYAESLRMLGQLHNIKVNIIAPGFVESAMTDQNEFPMPFKLDAPTAAKIIKKGLARNKRYVFFPKRMYFLSRIARFLPESFLTYVSQRTKGKANIIIRKS